MTAKTLNLMLLLLLLLPFPLSSQTKADELKVVAEQANIRQSPDIGSPIIYQAPLGSRLISLGKEGEWYRVELTSERGTTITGFVHESLVAPLKKPPLKKPEKPKDVKVEIPKKKQEAIEAPPPPPPVKPESGSASSWEMFPVEVRIGGALSFRSGGDINKGSEGLADFYAASLQAEVEDSIAPLHLAYAFGTEVHVQILPHFSLGLGFEYFKGSEESRTGFSGSAVPATYTTRPEFSAVPLKLLAIYAPISEFYVKGGLAYYFAECGYSYRFQQDDIWQEWVGEARGRTLGFLGGVGLKWEIARRIFVFAEAVGNYAKIAEFEGKNSYQESSGFSSQEEGKLYIYDGHVTQTRTFPLVYIREKRPAEANVSNPRLAGVDFSGVALAAGIQIRF